MNRRGFLGAILAAGVAPAIVRAANIMPVFLRREVGGLLVPEVSGMALMQGGGNTLLTIEMVTKEALRILEKNMAFMSALNSGFYDEFKSNDRITIRYPETFKGWLN